MIQDSEKLFLLLFATLVLLIFKYSVGVSLIYYFFIASLALDYGYMINDKCLHV